MTKRKYDWQNNGLNKDEANSETETVKQKQRNRYRDRERAADRPAGWRKRERKYRKDTCLYGTNRRWWLHEEVRFAAPFKPVCRRSLQYLYEISLRYKSLVNSYLCEREISLVMQAMRVVLCMHVMRCCCMRYMRSVQCLRVGVWVCLWDSLDVIEYFLVW